RLEHREHSAVPAEHHRGHPRPQGIGAQFNGSVAVESANRQPSLPLRVALVALPTELATSAVGDADSPGPARNRGLGHDKEVVWPLKTRFLAYPSRSPTSGKSPVSRNRPRSLRTPPSMTRSRRLMPR